MEQYEILYAYPLVYVHSCRLQGGPEAEPPICLNRLVATFSADYVSEDVFRSTFSDNWLALHAPGILLSQNLKLRKYRTMRKTRISTVLLYFYRRHGIYLQHRSRPELVIEA